MSNKQKTIMVAIGLIIFIVIIIVSSPKEVMKEAVINEVKEEVIETIEEEVIDNIEEQKAVLKAGWKFNPNQDSTIKQEGE